MRIIHSILKIVLFLLPFGLIAYSLISESGALEKNLPSRPLSLFPDGVIQYSVKPLSESYVFSDSLSGRTPPTVPSGKRVYPFSQTEFDSAVALYSDPLPNNEITLARGRNRWETFCRHCHGAEGRGDGPVITGITLSEDEEGFPGPPDYLRPETKALPDGRIFHIISSGQNLMFPAAAGLSVADRWCVVKYVRKLQGIMK